MGSDVPRGTVDIAKVGIAVAPPARWRTHRDEDRLGPRYCFGKVGGETKPTSGHVLDHQLGQARFIDRNLPLTERRDLVAVVVYANDLVAKLGKTGTAHESHITGTDDC